MLRIQRVSGENVFSLPPPFLNPKTLKLLEIVAEIYKKHGEKESFTKVSFKAGLGLYLGYSDKIIYPAFNFLAGLGVITVIEKSKKRGIPQGKVFFHPDKLLEYQDFPGVRKIYEAKQQAQRAKTKKELERMTGGVKSE